jgi:pimeloyl-ACP methyl ester carboxylesterase
MAAAERMAKVRALILGDPPLCIERFLAFEGSEERRSMWRYMQDLAASELPVPELASALADLPISAPGQETPQRYGDLPGVDTPHLLGWAKTLSQVDPDAAQYHVEGRLGEYVEKMDIDAALQVLTCPVLLLQGDPSQGGVVSDSDVQHAVSILPDILHVQLAGESHDLGLGTWKVTPLLRTVTNFLESL